MLYIILLAKTLIGLKKTTHQVHSLDLKKRHIIEQPQVSKTFLCLLLPETPLVFLCGVYFPLT